jgi:predicted HTH transcriptional regulator
MGLPPAKKLGDFQTRHLSAVRAAETNYSINARPQMIYEYLQQYGPATNRDIREYLNTGKASTTRMLQSLKEYGLVEYVSRDKEQFNAKQYSACSEEFVVPCSVCERVFDSIQGVKIHESVHNQE